MTESREGARQALERGDMFALFEMAREGLDVAPDDPEYRYLQALALARIGDAEAAIRSYERNRVAEIGSEDAIALKARLLKDLALRARQPERSALFREASETYGQAAALNDGYFARINEATTALLSGDRALATELAATILQREDLRRPGSYFAAATVGEGHLLGEDTARALEAFLVARKMPDANPGALASTTRQVAIILSELDLEESERDTILGALRPPPITHFCGHMLPFDWPGTDELRKRIRGALDRTGTMIAYGSLACGADILVAEAMVERDGEVHIVLPFDEADFINASVLTGGAGWLPRYQRVRDRAASVTFASQMPNLDDDNQFAYCSRLAMGTARLRAKTMQTEAVQLALWDGLELPAKAGTAADVREWTRQGGKSHIIDVSGERQLADDPALDRAAKVGPARALRAIMFADFSGFSKLNEQVLPGFLNFVMGTIAGILAKHSDTVLCRNSWGDAIYCVIESPFEAARIAIEIQSALEPALLQEAGLPPDGGMRISLHCGPIYEDFDPVQQAPTYYGTEVTLAARIEPRVPVGSIYTTQQFAALIDTQFDRLFEFEYVGTMHLAKNYGTRILYRLGPGAG